MRVSLRGWLLVLAVVGACEDPDSYGRGERAIVGGETDPGDPAVVAIVGDGEAYCTGTLISARVVVTAAHCLDPNFTGGRVITDGDVFFGSDVSREGTRLRISEAAQHPSWDSVSRKNDIAVLLLHEPAALPRVPLNTAALAPDVIGRPLRLVGFGSTHSRGMDGGIKRQARSQVLSYTETDFTYGDSTGQTCSGDSGGPAFLDEGDREVLVGVTSWGDGSCTEFGVDTRVDAFVASFLQPYLEQDRCARDGTCEPSCGATDPDCANHEVGEPCRKESDCGSGLCLPAHDDASLRFCTQACGGSEDCPREMVCVSTTQADLRVCAYLAPSPGATGWPCALAADCAHGLCVPSTEGAICSEPCYAKGNVGCPHGYTCGASSTEQPRYVCLPASSPSGGCSVARGQISLATLLFILLFLAATRWRVRRS